MDELLEQIEASLDAGHFYLALFCCLTLPDICGAISTPSGRARRCSYQAWFDRFVAPRYGGHLSGENCYAFRCAVLHQGIARHAKLGYDRILFLAPNSSDGPLLHNNVLNDALNLDLRTFCADILSGVRSWMRASAGDATFEANIQELLARHPGGLAGYVVGTDMYS